VSGVELVDPIPGNLRATTVSAAGVVASAREPTAARALITFLRSPQAMAIVKEKGLVVCEALADNLQRPGGSRKAAAIVEDGQPRPGVLAILSDRAHRAVRQGTNVYHPGSSGRRPSRALPAA